MPACIVSTYQLPEQAGRLIRHLSDLPDTVVVVHSDQRAGPEHAQALRAAIGRRDNVVHLPSRVCRYATFDHVHVTLDGIAWLLDRGVAFDHLLLLTGQCYPIKPAERLVAWLDERRGRSVLEHRPFPHPTWPDGGYNRVNAWVLPVSVARVPAVVRRALPKRASWLALPKPSLLRHRLGGAATVRLPAAVPALWGGFGYWAMARAHVEYVHAHREPFVRFFRRSYIPDELFFQTILATSPHRDELIDERLHLVDFRRQGGMSPYVWRADDFATIAASDRPFARKFDERVDVAILDRIDRELR